MSTLSGQASGHRVELGLEKLSKLDFNNLPGPLQIGAMQIIENGTQSSGSLTQ